jgi:AcrR family transcriptional regulator
MTVLEPSRRERKKDETRERIAAVALRLFVEQGFDRTTVDQIAEAADVAKGTFFNYFPRKEALLAALADQKVSEMEHFAEGLLKGRRPVRRKLLDLVARAGAIHSQQRDLSRLLLAEMLVRPMGPMSHVHVRAQSMVRRFVDQGQATGELRPDVDPDRAASVLRGVALGTVLIWLSSDPGTFVLEDEIRKRVTLVLDGLAEPASKAS